MGPVVTAEERRFCQEQFSPLFVGQESLVCCGFMFLIFGNYNWTYGTIGTFIILLLWLNFSSLVMLLGAQLNVTVGKAMKEKR